jgi:hypothetical protein
MKPDWNDAPRWAGFLAMDADGTWWWHQEQPRFARDDSGMWVSDGKFKCISGPDTSGDYDWDFAYDTCEARPGPMPEDDGIRWHGREDSK